ncbi:MFS transporter [bacterium LRH843]|nr:MFS transporter [bacterium LRH843]
MYTDKEKVNFYRILIAMIIGSFINHSSLYWVQPLIMLFSIRFNQSPATASLVISITTISIAFALLLAPFVANNLGRKNTMVLSLSLTSVLNLISVAIDHFYWLLFVRFLVGVCLSGFLASVITYLKEEVVSDRLGRIVSIYIAGTAFGGVSGRIISSFLVEHYELSTMVMMYGGATLIASLLFGFILPKSTNFEKRPYALKNLKQGFSASLLTNNIRSIYVSCFFTIGIYTSVLNYISYPLSEPPFSLSQTVIGLLYFATLSGMVGSLIFGRFIGIIFDISLYRISLFVMAFGAILMTTNVLWLVFIGLFIFAFGMFASNTVASNWLANKAPSLHKTEATSLYSIFYYLGSSMIGWLSGYVFLFFGWSSFIFIVSGLLLIIIFLLRKVKNNEGLLHANT